MGRQSSRKIIQTLNASYPDSGKSPYYEFGYKYYGPFLYGFTRWLSFQIDSAKVRKVFFFARDGYMMQKAYLQLGGRISSEYVYFSRKSLRQALLYKANTYEESLQLLSWKRYVTISEWLSFYGFSSDEIPDMLHNKSLDATSSYRYEDLGNTDQLKKLYAELKPEIDKRSQTQSALLLQYLEQIGMNEDCIIVDIGWHGNMQMYLEKFLQQNGIDIHITGLYVGIESNGKTSGDVYGFLYDDLDTKCRKSILCFLGIYEKLFQSKEGSTDGYMEDNGMVVPRLLPYEYKDDPAMIRSIDELQSGALDAVRKLAENPPKASQLSDFALPLINYGKYPSRKAVKLFSNMYNVDGIKIYFVAQKSLFHYRLKEFKHDLSNSPWKTGFMKSVFKIPFPYFFVYRVLRK